MLHDPHVPDRSRRMVISEILQLDAEFISTRTHLQWHDDNFHWNSEVSGCDN